MAIDVYIPEDLQFLLKNHNNIHLEVEVRDYITDDFIRLYTKFDSFDEFIEFSPFTEEELIEDSKLYESDKMNRYIYLSTQFESYAAMLSFAVRTKLRKIVEKYK